MKTRWSNTLNWHRIRSSFTKRRDFPLATGFWRSGRRLCAVALALSLVACTFIPAVPQYSDASRAERLRQLLPADIILLGEQHDAADHQQVHRIVVEALAARNSLAALALEMASQGHSTAGLAGNATEDAVRQALQWNNEGWPWSAYGPAVMAAVRAGVPVMGANLPAAQLRNAMADTLAKAVRTGKTVVLLAGGGHVDRSLGVPLHLAPGLKVKAVLIRPEIQADRTESVSNFDALWPAQAAPIIDYCAEFGASRRPSI